MQYGDWSNKDAGGFLRCIQGPVKKLKIWLTVRCRVKMMDEFQTDELHNACGQRMHGATTMASRVHTARPPISSMCTKPSPIPTDAVQDLEHAWGCTLTKMLPRPSSVCCDYGLGPAQTPTISLGDLEQLQLPPFVKGYPTSGKLRACTNNI